MQKLSSNTAPIIYRDFYFRALVCLFAAHYIVMMGVDFSSFKAFTIKSYYPTLAINYAIALILAFSVKKITVKLDRLYPWEKDLWVRLFLQFAIGIVLVSLLSFFLVFIYFVSFGQKIMESTYPKYEFPFSVALITILNAFYAIYYFYNRVRSIEGNPEEDQSFYSEFLNVAHGNKTYNLAVREIACIFILENIVLVRSFNKTDYISDMTLDELESKLNPNEFFRINRQLIAAKNACTSFQVLEYGKLDVTLQPISVVSATVSQKKATSFRNWMEKEF